MNELYTLQFYYDIIFGQGYKLVPRASIPVPISLLDARDHLIAQTNNRLERANNGKNR